jgi:hypothetical protein
LVSHYGGDIVKPLSLLSFYPELEPAVDLLINEFVGLHRPFEGYLTMVIASLPADYLDVQEPQINDILQRHHTLKETNLDLQAVLQNRLDDIEKETNRLNDLIKMKNDRILVYNSELGALQKKLDRGKTESARVESLVAESVLSGKARVCDHPCLVLLSVHAYWKMSIFLMILSSSLSCGIHATVELVQRTVILICLPIGICSIASL